MFINQAILQFERFTGVDAPVEVMRKVVMEHLKS
jgi:shikimate dehydrogenase